VAKRVDLLQYQHPPSPSGARRRRRSSRRGSSLAVVGLAGIVVAVVTVLAVIGLGGGSKRTPTPFLQTTIPRHTLAIDPLAHGDRVALGLSPASSPGQAVEEFDRLAGVAPKVIMWFQTWQNPILYPADLEAARSVRAIPMITWDPEIGPVGIPLSAIAAGAYDSYIRSAARMVKAYGRVLYIRFAHEMNLPAAPFGPGRDGNTPAEYVAAWRHVVEIFRQVGARNAEFVWSPNVYCEGHCPFTPFYPGNAWVDWVALDGYNYGPVHDDPWMSFTQIFGASYDILARLTDRPMMIGETGCASLGGDKAAWITSMARALATRFRRIRVLVWFERIKEADFLINSSRSSLAAFRKVVRTFPFSS
jgi:hypothetical protein